MKKKNPPYAIIGAALLGLVAIFALVKWKQGQDAAHAAEMKAAADKAAADLAAAQANKEVPQPTAPTDMRYVWYATQPVAAGAKISAAFYEKKLTPNGILPDAFTDSTDIVGYYAVRNIEKGDPLTPRNIGKSLPFLSERISPGMRAISLNVFNAEYNLTGGFVVDGDKVDLLYSTDTPPTIGDFKVNTQMVMQNVSVLYAPGSKIDSEQLNGVQPSPQPGEALSVTFEVTPEQAQALIFLSHVKNGKFSMILRSRRDHEEIKIKPFDIRDYDFYKLTKVQKMVNKSNDRVAELKEEIEAKEKAMAHPGNTNETPNPTPPSP